MTAIAPATSNHHQYRPPCLVMLPSLSLPPVECCIGTNPIQAAGNFDEYQVVRLANTPKIEVYLALSSGEKWCGISEPDP
jgi:hypothetical protein